MEGYSVTEAASVLGVPTERVWELLARGVLSGAPEGDTGMRVFLQPRPAPTPLTAEPKPANGNGDPAQRDPEASPFRELLTEFRNLTERYGQALLALGEARGEVASLRSRVDVLEARMDLRLPFGQPTAPSAQRAPYRPPAPPADPTPTPTTVPDLPVRSGSAPEARAPDERAPEARAPDERARDAAVADEAASADHDAESESGGDGDADRAARRRRSRAHFVEEFAEALARAEDPNPAELPGGADAAAAFAALQAETAPVEEAGADATDASLPRELPVAESMIEPEPEPELAAAAAAPVADQEVATDADQGAATEPGPQAWPAVDAAPQEPEFAADTRQEEAAAVEAEPPVGAAEPEAASEVEVTSESEADARIGAADGSSAERADADADAVTEPQAVDASDDVEAAGEHENWDRDRYTAVIEEPDWWTPDAAGWDDPLPTMSHAAAESEAPAEPASGAPRDEEAGTTASYEPEPEPEPEPESQSKPEPKPEPKARRDDAEPPAASAPIETAEDEQPATSPGRAIPEAGFAASIGLDQPLAESAGEETMLWFGTRPAPVQATSRWPTEDPASEMEIAGAGAAAPRSGGAGGQLPGGDELDDALAALADHGGSAQPPDADAPPATDDEDEGSTSAAGDQASGSAGPEPRTVELPSPASRAYRRLRRIFPG